MREIESRFLVSADIMRWLKKQSYTSKRIEKFYVKSEDGSLYCYEKTFPNSFKKTKEQEGLEAKSEQCSKEEYIKQKKQRIGKKLTQKVYTVVIDSEEYMVIEYKKRLKGIFLLFASFDSHKLLRESKTLESLHTFVLKTIDKDKKYEALNLALHIKPMEYDLNKLFENIDAYEAANLFFWQVPKRLYVRDGVTLILYKNLRLIHHYQVNYQRKHYSATLHRLRVLFRRTATLLDKFASLFNPNVQRFATSLLMRYHDETKLLRYLYFLEELSATKEDVTLSLHSALKTFTSEEEKAVVQMFYAKPFKQLIQIITRELYEEGYHKGNTLKREVKKVVKEELQSFKVLLFEAKKGWDEELLEEIYVSIDSIHTLVEDFFHILGEKETKELVEELNILLRPLREYRNCKEREKMLLGMKAQLRNETLDITPLLCTKINELQKSIEHALKLLRSSQFYI
jgi:hypothetical protein